MSEIIENLTNIMDIVDNETAAYINRTIVSINTLKEYEVEEYKKIMEMN